MESRNIKTRTIAEILVFLGLVQWAPLVAQDATHVSVTVTGSDNKPVCTEQSLISISCVITETSSEIAFTLEDGGFLVFSSSQSGNTRRVYYGRDATYLDIAVSFSLTD